MEKPSERNPTPMWVGIGCSVVFFAVLLVLQSNESSLLALPPQWLVVALIPAIIGLAVGGYIREMKAGDYGASFTDLAAKKSVKIPDSAASGGAKSMAPLPTEGWLQDRQKEYERTQGYMLAHAYRPSKEIGQHFDISIFLVQHRKGTVSPPREQFSEIKSAEFFFGESWGNSVFKVDGEDGFFGVRTHAWGTFLATCRICFKDAARSPIVLYRYIDFSMAKKND